MDTEKNFEEAKGDSVFKIPEKRLVALVGCSPLEVQKARYTLTEGFDFKKLGRSYFWTMQAAHAFASGILGSEAATILELRYDALAEAGVTEPVVLTVLRRKTANPHILLATDGSHVFRVRVKSKVNFRGDMLVNCKHVQADLYELVGNCPRQPGKY